MSHRKYIKQYVVVKTSKGATIMQFYGRVVRHEEHRIVLRFKLNAGVYRDVTVQINNGMTVEVTNVKS